MAIISDLYQRAQTKEEQKAVTLMVTLEDLIHSWMTKVCKGNGKNSCENVIINIMFFILLSRNN